MRRNLPSFDSNRRARRGLTLFLAGSILLIAQSCLAPRPDTVSAEPAPPPTFQQAVNSYSDGGSDVSLAILERLAHDHPLDQRVRWELVRQLEETGSYRLAISTLMGLYGVDPHPDRVTGALFVARVLAGRFTDAAAMLPLPSPSVSTVFFEGYLAMATGDSTRADRLFHQTIAMHADQPMAWYFLGKLALARGDDVAAQRDFERVRRLNPNITMAIPPLAEAVLAQGKTSRAYPLLLRARDILPDNLAIRRDIKRLELQNPGLLNTASRNAQMQQRNLFPPPARSFPPTGAAGPIIRVGLAEHLHSLTIKTGGAFELRSLKTDQALTFHGRADQVLKLTYQDSKVIVSHPGKPPLLSWTAPVSLTYENRAATTLVFDLLTESGSFFAASADRAYRGELIFRPGETGFTLINRLPLEEYLYAVLPSEMYASWPLEALKAQAVAARSYTLASMGTYDNKGFDVYGSVRSAAYQGVTNESPATTRAVNETAGQVLEFHNKPLKAYYSANSGGYTESAKVLWGEEGGMKAVADLKLHPRTHFLSLTKLTQWLESDPASYSSVPPYFSPSSYRWTKWVPAAEVERRANRIEKIGPLYQLIVKGRGISGRVYKIELVGLDGRVTVQGDQVRAVLGDLRSNLFTVRPLLGANGRPKYYLFAGGGWGHGIGMDQDGAAGMAAAGYTYREILAHYYPRATLLHSPARGAQSSPSPHPGAPAPVSTH